ncbi:MAG: hypothetical protein JXA99_10575 [Candidatus Lokiarchaeota archaeon]|nr:hypothetical protein [Candidatus Lokiarchaeota archaeon]
MFNKIIEIGPDILKRILDVNNTDFSSQLADKNLLSRKDGYIFFNDEKIGKIRNSHYSNNEVILNILNINGQYEKWKLFLQK